MHTYPLFKHDQDLKLKACGVVSTEASFHSFFYAKMADIFFCCLLALAIPFDSIFKVNIYFCSQMFLLDDKT